MIAAPGSFDALADLFAAMVAERLRPLLTAIDGLTYDSRQLPPRCSRRRFTELCRDGRVAGAHKDGRNWVCTRIAWDAARQRATSIAAEPGAIRDRADALLARAGLRVIRGPK